MLFYSGCDHMIIASKDSSWLDMENRTKHNQFIMTGCETNTANFLTCQYMHGEEQELKQETTAMPACYVPVFLKKKHNNAHKAVWSTKATVTGAISAFVHSIDSHIISMSQN